MTAFKRKRLAAGLTQSQLAKRMGVSQAAIGNWEAGRDIPSPEFIPRLAKLFKMSAEEVTYIFDAPQPAAA